MLAYFACLVIGAIIGMLATAMCVVAKRSDRHED